MPVALPPGRLKLSTILQSGQAFAAISIHPLANRPRADACSFRDRLRRLPVLDLPCNLLSTSRREFSQAFLCLFTSSRSR